MNKMKHTLAISKRAGYRSTVTGAQVSDPGFVLRQDEEMFFLLQNVHLTRGPPTLLFNGYRDLSLVVKRPGREPNHSPPFRTQLKNVWS
jgi:hypothetical protein